jgi:hypothetical protein
MYQFEYRAGYIQCILLYENGINKQLPSSRQANVRGVAAARWAAEQSGESISTEFSR